MTNATIPPDGPGGAVDEVQQTRAALQPEDVPGIEGDVFRSSDVLATIWTAARARGASPWGVLGAVLARTATAAGPGVTLPPIIGGRASLNIIVGLVAPSGIGKGAATAVADELFGYAYKDGNGFEPERRPLGSGQGIEAVYRPKLDKDGEVIEEAPDRVLFSAPEIDSVSASSSRQGSTILETLRKAWSGEQLGHTGATAETTRNIPAHEYRFVLEVGIQPGRSGVLLMDAAGGTPQRILWMPLVYPGMPDVKATAPDRYTVTLPKVAKADKHEMHVPEWIQDQIYQEHIDKVRGEATGDAALNTHMTLTRLKTAAVLALMHGEEEVRDVDWSVAGKLIAMSRQTRNSCAKAVRELDMARREDEQDRKDEISERGRKKRKTVRDGTLSRLRGAEGTWVPFRSLNSPLKGYQRKYLDGVLDELKSAGLVECQTAQNGLGEDSTEWRARSTGSTESNAGQDEDSGSTGKVHGVHDSEDSMKAVDHVDHSRGPQKAPPTSNGPRGPVDLPAKTDREGSTPQKIITNVLKKKPGLTQGKLSRALKDETGIGLIDFTVLDNMVAAGTLRVDAAQHYYLIGAAA